MTKSHALFPHQEQALAYALPRRRIALFMEMRLGKTSVVARWAKAHGCRRVLVLAPLTTLRGSSQWEGELAREGLETIALPSLPKDRWIQAMTQWKSPSVARPFLHRVYRRAWVLLNFDAVLFQADLLAQPWDGIVIDESTRIRNPQAKLTKLLTAATGHIRHRAILSGLPNPESPLDYFSQFKFLDGEFMGVRDYWSYRARHFHEGYTAWDWQPNPGVRELIRTAVHDRAFVLLRKTAGVGSEKFRRQVRVKQSTAQLLAARELKKHFELAGKMTKWVTVQQMWLQRLAGGWHPTLDPPELLSDAKLQALRTLCAAEAPCVVWFRFNHEIESAYAFLKKQEPRLRCAYVHGEVPNSKEYRIEVQEAFQAGKLDVVLLQVKLGRFGWNLSRANTAIYYSNTYEFEDRSQSEDRIIHLTKKDPCYYIDLVTEGSMDEEVVEAVSEKRMTARLFSHRMNDAVRARFGGRA